MCRLRNIAMRDYQESVTTGQTHGHTDRRRTKRSLCAAMLRMRHNKIVSVFQHIRVNKNKSNAKINVYAFIFLNKILFMY